jgi:hypothetical protein
MQPSMMTEVMRKLLGQIPRWLLEELLITVTVEVSQAIHGCKKYGPSGKSAVIGEFMVALYLEGTMHTLCDALGRGKPIKLTDHYCNAMMDVEGIEPIIEQIMRDAQMLRNQGTN